MPYYTELDYFKLAAECRARNLSSGGSQHVLRARLIKDDTLVAEGKERVDVLSYRATKKRGCKTERPDLDSLARKPKSMRKRGDDQDDIKDYSSKKRRS
jgi:hypothetical protein